MVPYSSIEWLSKWLLYILRINAFSFCEIPDSSWWSQYEISKCNYKLNIPDDTDYLIDHLVGDSVSVFDSTDESVIVLSLNTLGVDVDCGKYPECDE